MSLLKPCVSPSSFETRFHVQVLDHNGHPTKLDPMPLEEFQAFQDKHWDDSVDYLYQVSTTPVHA